MAPKLLPALLGGLYIGVLSALPFVSLGNCCCLWVITGGMLAAYVMQQNHPRPVSVGEGAIVGLLAGLFGAILHYLVSLPLAMVVGPFMPGGGLDGVMPGSRRDVPPEVRRLLDEMGPRGMLLLGSVLFAGVALVFGMLGGMLGAVFFRKAPPPPPPAPWTPSTFREPSWTPPPPPMADEKPPEGGSSEGSSGTGRP